MVPRNVTGSARNTSDVTPVSAVWNRCRKVSPGVSIVGILRPGTVAPMPPPPYPVTPDGRYFVVRGRLWRTSNPALPAERREELVRALMDARRGKRGTLTDVERAAARQRIDELKRELGERGPVWWTDGAPDLNRHMARTTPYAEWFSQQG